MDTPYLYLLLNIITFLLPFVLSFDKKVAYFRRWKYLFPSILIVGALFIIWDVIFTHLGVWGFNERYLTGIDIINLPLEEWLFFITVPYASVFIYDCIKAYFPSIGFPATSRKISIFLAVILLVFGFVKIDLLYTSITFITLSITLIIISIFRVDYLGRFLISYLIVLIPFFIVNGILTGSGIQDQVVWYNNSENLSFRLFTIPVEDVFYGMLLVLGNVALYEYFQKKD